MNYKPFVKTCIMASILLLAIKLMISATTRRNQKQVLSHLQNNEFYKHIDLLQPGTTHLYFSDKKLTAKHIESRALIDSNHFLCTNAQSIMEGIAEEHLKYREGFCKTLNNFIETTSPLAHNPCEAMHTKKLVLFLNEVGTYFDAMPNYIFNDSALICFDWTADSIWLKKWELLINNALNLCNTLLQKSTCPNANFDISCLIKKLHDLNTQIKKDFSTLASMPDSKDAKYLCTLHTTRPTKFELIFNPETQSMGFNCQPLKTAPELSNQPPKSSILPVTHNETSITPEQASIIPTQVLTQQEILDRSKNYKGPDKFDLEKLMERHNNPTPVDKAIKDVLAKLDERSNNVSLCSKMLVHVFSKLQVIPEFANDAEAQDTLKLLRDLSFFDKQGSKNFIMWSNEWVSEGFMLEQQRVIDAERSMSKAALVLSHKFGQYKQTPNTPEEEQNFKSISDTMAQLRAEDKNMG